MATLIKKPNWSHVVRGLKRRVAAGDIAAMRDLGLTLVDGIQNHNGRTIVRRNSTYAVRLLRQAAEGGDGTAARALGYAYDVGNGVPRDTAAALTWYRHAAKMGDTVAATNIATVYRDQGDLRRAHRWLLRAMKR